jgi:hypothetical protein
MKALVFCDRLFSGWYFVESIQRTQNWSRVDSKHSLLEGTTRALRCMLLTKFLSLSCQINTENTDTFLFCSGWCKIRLETSDMQKKQLRESNIKSDEYL